MKEQENREFWIRANDRPSRNISIDIFIFLCIVITGFLPGGAKRLACQVAKPLIEALEAGSPFPLRRHH